jgi:hypothetical protein
MAKSTFKPCVNLGSSKTCRDILGATWVCFLLHSIIPCSDPKLQADIWGCGPAGATVQASRHSTVHDVNLERFKTPPSSPTVAWMQADANAPGRVAGDACRAPPRWTHASVGRVGRGDERPYGAAAEKNAAKSRSAPGTKVADERKRVHAPRTVPRTWRAFASLGDQILGSSRLQEGRRRPPRGRPCRASLAPPLCCTDTTVEYVYTPQE